MSNEMQSAINISKIKSAETIVAIKQSDTCPIFNQAPHQNNLFSIRPPITNAYPESIRRLKNPISAKDCPSLKSSNGLLN